MAGIQWLDIGLNKPVKDIGIEGLSVSNVAPKSHIYDFYAGYNAIVASERISLDMIDITTIGDTERVYMQCFTGNQGTM